MTSLLLLVTALAVVVLIAVAATALLRGRRRTARRSGAAVLVLVVLYAAVLIGASVNSRPRTLRAGEWKCFDDWCVTLSSAAPTPSGQELSLAVRNAGRGRVQRPDAPHAYLELTGRAPVEFHPAGLDQQLAAGQKAEITCPIAWTGTGRLVVTEGGWPSRLVIGDENTAWHAHTGWNL
jgi:hypothetical protein